MQEASCGSRKHFKHSVERALSKYVIFHEFVLVFRSYSFVLQGKFPLLLYSVHSLPVIFFSFIVLTCQWNSLDHSDLALLTSSDGSWNISPTSRGVLSTTSLSLKIETTDLITTYNISSSIARKKFTNQGNEYNFFVNNIALTVAYHICCLKSSKQLNVNIFVANECYHNAQVSLNYCGIIQNKHTSRSNSGKSGYLINVCPQEYHQDFEILTLFRTILPS